MTVPERCDICGAAAVPGRGLHRRGYCAEHWEAVVVEMRRFVDRLDSEDGDDDA